MHTQRIAAISRLGLTSALCLLFLGLVGEAFAGGAPQAQGPFAAAKLAAARNQAALRQYTWIETTQVSYNGDVKSTKVESCSYGPDGQLQKTEVSATEPKKEPGLRGMIQERKTDEITSELQSAVVLVHSYVPPAPDKLQAAVASGHMQMVPAAPGVATLVFSNYQLPGDALTLTFAIDAKEIQTVDVSSWLDSPSKPVTLVVQFQTLPDGTNYPATSTLAVPASNLQVAITNSNYQRLAQ